MSFCHYCKESIPAIFLPALKYDVLLGREVGLCRDCANEKVCNCEFGKNYEHGTMNSSCPVHGSGAVKILASFVLEFMEEVDQLKKHI